MSGTMIDIDRILAEAHELAFPRYPGTEGDRRAIALLEGKLRAAGLQTAVEWFSYDLRPALRALRAMLVAAGLLAGAAGLTGPASPGLGLLLLLLSVAPAAMLLTWAPWLDRLYRRDGPVRTANLTGRRRAAVPRLTLVLMAHHDSKSQNLTLPWRSGFAVVALLGVLGLTGVLLAGLLGGTPSVLARLAPVLGIIVAAACLVLSTLSNGNRSPGGVDNAGSVAIALELGRVLARKLPADVELLVLSTGAEEDHMVGAMRWLDSHLGELVGRPIYCLNFDGAGARGRTVLMERYGALVAFSPTLTRLARDAAARLGMRPRRIVTPPAMGIDAIPFAHRGVECLTFSSGSLGRATLAVHSAGDVPDNLDRAALADVAQLACEVALGIAGSRF